ncbi:hypothetical protein L204_103269 [Cryptococcus depauperatus]|nr:hypothetical protein L204_01584 [Cryptococcus depauperatus CBS 7855]
MTSSSFTFPESSEKLAASLDSALSPSAFVNTLLSPLLPPPLGSGQSPQPPDLAPINNALNDLVTQLSLLSQDTGAAVEQIMSEVGRSVPRLGYDLQFMRESASALNIALNTVQARVSKQTQASSPSIQQRHSSITVPLNKNDQSLPDSIKTQHALEKVTHLDKLKTRLEAARDILREAESWNTLEEEISNLIASDELTKAGQRLAEADRSMVVFKNQPSEYEERRRLLTSLGDELESAAGKKMHDAFDRSREEGQEGWEQVRVVYGVFRDMDRIEEFRGWYSKMRSSSLLALWNEPILEEVNPVEPTPESSSINRFVNMLPKFYASCLHLLTNEMSYVPLIFDSYDSSMMLSSLIQYVLDSIDPPFGNRLGRIVEYHGNLALPEIVTAWKATLELGFDIQGLIGKIALNTLSEMGSMLVVNSPSSGPSLSSPPGIPLSSSATNFPHSYGNNKRRQSVSSRRFSRAASLVPTYGVDGDLSDAKNKPEDSIELDNAWETGLYEPFLDWQASYSSLEQNYLHSILSSLKLVMIDSNENRSGVISSAHEKVKRRGKGKESVSQMIGNSVQVFEKAREAVKRCRVFTLGFGAVGLEKSLDAFLEEWFTDQVDSLSSMVPSLSTSAAPTHDLDLDNDGDGDESSMAFQVTLHVLDACKKLAGNVNEFERELREEMISWQGVLRATKERWTEVWLPGAQEKESKIAWKAASLLQQSTLNTVDLHTLFSSLSTTKLLPQTQVALNNLTSQTQVILIDLILHPLFALLDTYPSLSTWSKSSRLGESGEGRTSQGLRVPEFSLSPTDVIARLAEGVLGLLRVWEVYGNTESLGFSLSTLPNLPASDEDMIPSSSPSPAEIQQMYLASLIRTLLSRLLNHTLPQINGLSIKGGEQLREDMEYLGNAVSALEVVDWNDGRHLVDGLRLGEDEWREKYKGKGDDVLRLVGKMRGWVQ